jgi:4-amino-4-deoxy-L-arabinose transferase-like glycosyltransferase
MTCVVFFSMVSGIFHAYYVVMLAPALGAIVGGGFGSLWKMQAEGRAGSGWWLTLGVAATVAFQLALAWQYGVNEYWMPLAFVLVALGASLLFVSLFRSSPLLPRSAFSILLSALLVIPLAWSALTVTDGTNSNLPAAYGVNGGPGNARIANVAASAQSQGEDASDSLLDYLQANTVGMKYLVAVESSQAGASYVIETGRPVLYMGGFSGGDDVVSADDLAQLVANGELRFVLFGMGGRNNKQDVVQWLQSACSVVDDFSQRSASAVQSQGPNQGGQVLYDCQ